jgi:hypothetical protein
MCFRGVHRKQLSITHMRRMNNSFRTPSIQTGMKKNILIYGALVGATITLVSGCVERTVYVQSPPPPGAPVVTEAPPPPQTEVVVAAPGPGYFWVPGYWSWQGRWIWVGGCWRVRPHPHAVWVSGHWAHHAHGYYWVEGRWR